ncbi:MAG: pyridoxal 5'-phosphate synthase, partial [Limisphaerales bacterium]
GRELDENPHASLVFYWKELERQVCIGGAVRKIMTEESEKYFNLRPRGAQLAAWVSHQSGVIKDRPELEKKFHQMSEKYYDRIPLPPYWGGFVVAPVTIEFWQGQANRLHDRFCYTKQENGGWLIERLSP